MPVWHLGNTLLPHYELSCNNKNKHVTGYTTEYTYSFPPPFDMADLMAVLLRSEPSFFLENKPWPAEAAEGGGGVVT